LRGISSRAWEHPADRGALVALRELKGFDVVLRKLFSLLPERAIRLQYLGGSVRVDRHQYQSVHNAYLSVASVLDVPEPPELYVTQDPYLNGMTIGLDKPIIVINSAAVSQFDEAELRFLLGHELGHAQSGHALYKTMLSVLLALTGSVSWIPGGAIGLRLLIAALYEWDRKSELSADRAGLLAVQNPTVGIRQLAKLAGGGDLSEIDIAAFLEQAKEFEGGGDLRESFLKILMISHRTHDFPVERAAALNRWVTDGEYQDTLAGNYARREDDGDTNLTEEAKSAARHYRDEFNRSEDPLTKTLRKLKERVTPPSDN
jgi:Zn-dependent protease with chaperone function